MQGKGYSFNAEYVKRLTKSKFIKNFEKVYPQLDLSAIYDEIVERKNKG